MCWYNWHRAGLTCLLIGVWRENTGLHISLKTGFISWLCQVLGKHLETHPQTCHWRKVVFFFVWCFLGFVLFFFFTFEVLIRLFSGPWILKAKIKCQALGWWYYQGRIANRIACNTFEWCCCCLKQNYQLRCCLLKWALWHWIFKGYCSSYLSQFLA